MASSSGQSVATKGREGRWRRALEVTARAVAAIGLGYVLAGLATAALARLLPGPAVEATQAATLFSFTVYAVMACWAFADRSVGRVWAFGALACAVLAGVVALSLQMEPRL